MRVLVQLRHTQGLHAASTMAAPSPLVAEMGDHVAGFLADPTYPPVQVPAMTPLAGGHVVSLGQPVSFSLEPTLSSYVVRGEVPDGAAQTSALAALQANPAVVGVFADPAIESHLVCPGSAAVGTSANVATQLGVKSLHAKGLDGAGVALAIVDSGISLAHLSSVGQNPTLDQAKSFTPQNVPTTPGAHPVGHGTMCAFDALIAAPKASLLDHAVLLTQASGATVMSGLLSDAVLSYSHLLTTLTAMPAKKRALVISNSWGMFNPAWDFPLGHPGNYSDNLQHPFNVIVATLEANGADVLFAAGNCGVDCPDGRCAFGATPPICGANSHPRVLSIAGVDVKKKRVGYSSQGPGRLSYDKPDLSAYTHFRGSGVYPADGGTSAACPVAAGVVAAVRTKYPAAKLAPSQLRALIFKTAEDLSGKGFDHDTGWGVIDPKALLKLLP